MTKSTNIISPPTHTHNEKFSMVAPEHKTSGLKKKKNNSLLPAVLINNVKCEILKYPFLLYMKLNYINLNIPHRIPYFKNWYPMWNIQVLLSVATLENTHTTYQLTKTVT